MHIESITNKVFARIFLIIFVCLLVLPSVGFAEIYKYKDKNGRWQFSGAPKKGAGSTAVRSYKSDGSSSQANNDFDKLLNDKYGSRNPVQQATLAVVTVKSSLGTGSGFFVTNDCYLITNKHVVRPAKGKQSK